jgi:hypothetical protein
MHFRHRVLVLDGCVCATACRRCRAYSHATRVRPFARELEKDADATLFPFVDNRGIQIAASFGALTGSTDQTTRYLDLDLRVGDYSGCWSSLSEARRAERTRYRCEQKEN